jgi:hypothetical protein
LKIAKTIRGISLIISKHVRRKGNAVANYFVNVEVGQIPKENKWWWRDVGLGTFIDIITQFYNGDTLHKDGGIFGEFIGLGLREPDVPTTFKRSNHQHIVHGGQELDLDSRYVVENEDEWKGVGSKACIIRKVQRLVDEKAAMRYGDGMTPMASKTSTIGIMVMREKYWACGKIMKSVNIVRKMHLIRIDMKVDRPININGNQRNLAHRVVNFLGRGG